MIFMPTRKFFAFLDKYKNENVENKIVKPKLTLGQRAADYVTTCVGSWRFIIGVLIFICLWMIVNVIILLEGWDPYPFILLNFCLSCLAAIQAPIILMSQNRQTEIDRVRAEYDYKVNIKAEKEINNMQKDLNNIKHLINELHECNCKKRL